MLKRIMVEAARVAVNHDGRMRAFYERVIYRRRDRPYTLIFLIVSSSASSQASPLPPPVCPYSRQIKVNLSFLTTYSSTLMLSNVAANSLTN
jgi:hypothetical protein